MALGSSGWKARQERARAKNSKGKSKEEREAIRAARRKLYERNAEQAAKEKQSEGTGEPVQEVVGDTVADQDYEEVEMTRDEMIAALQAAGQTVHPATKDETLAKKVEALNEAEE